MKIYVCHPKDYDYENELYKPLKEFNSNNQHEIFFPHDRNNIQNNTSNIIKESDLIIAEISQPSTGLGIELGRAETFKKNIICIYKKNSNYSNSIKFVSDKFIEYNNSEELILKLKKEIIKFNLKN